MTLQMQIYLILLLDHQGNGLNIQEKLSKCTVVTLKAPGKVVTIKLSKERKGE
jgi:hypothetical protein